MHVELPDNVVANARQLASSAGFNDLGDYLAHLVSREQDEKRYHAVIEQKLLEGLKSPGVIMTKDDWDGLRNLADKGNA